MSRITMAPNLFLLLTLLLVLSSCSEESLFVSENAQDGTAQEGTSPLAKKGNWQAVPFKGTWINAGSPPVPPEETPAGCEIYFATSQVGNAAHLGNLTGTGATCAFNLRVGVDNPPFNLSGGAPPFLVADFTNEMTWTAANGDKLFLSPNSGVFVQSLTDLTSSVRGSLIISGGTGRFESATGEANVRGVGDRVQFRGMIIYDASRRGQP